MDVKNALMNAYATAPGILGDLRMDDGNRPCFLVLVPGHGVYEGPENGTLADIANPGNWHTSYPDDVRLYLEHIATAMSVANYLKEKGYDTCLVFSGARVKKVVGGELRKPERSEAESYKIASRILANSIDASINVPVKLEQSAYSSYGNLVFSLAHAPDSSVPELVVVNFEFKKNRFMHYASLHGIPLVYIGVNNPQFPDLEKAVREEGKLMEIIRQKGPLAAELVEKRKMRGQPEHQARLLEQFCNGRCLGAEELMEVLKGVMSPQPASASPF